MKKFFKYLKLVGLSEWIALAVLSFAVVSAVLNFVTIEARNFSHDNHLVLLADQFSHFNLSYGINHPEGDIVDYYANFYSYFGPMSSLVFVPFVVIFDNTFPQVSLGIISLIGSFICVHLLAKEFSYNSGDRIWWATFFCFSTVLTGVSLINVTAYQIQALGTFFVLLSLLSYYQKRPWWLSGMFVACAGMTRLTLYGVLIFFCLEWFRKKMGIKQLVLLLLPVAISFGVLGLYNYRRFGSFTESGYGYNITLKTFPMSENLKGGFLSVSHIPSNLYALFLQAPDPLFKAGGGFNLNFPYMKVNPWGLSIFISSPLLLVLFAKYKLKREVVSATIASGIILVPILMYFGIGYSQFGYRYALDFLPLLLVILLRLFPKKLSTRAKVLITGGVIFNSLYLTSIWGWYPHFWAEINEGGRVVFGGNQRLLLQELFH